MIALSMAVNSFWVLLKIMVLFFGEAKERRTCGNKGALGKYPKKICLELKTDPNIRRDAFNELFCPETFRE